ncbi:MAG: signal peptidase I [Clostridia bacterium]|nr:signal peptidase I [Clostridia bacterium]
MQEDFTTEVKPISKNVSTIYETLESIVMAIVFVIFIFVFLAKLSVVDGKSMVPTLSNKDYLIVSNPFFSYEPDNGDIVVIQTKKHETALVKRVIATEGQQITIEYNFPFDRSFNVYINGQLVEENYANFNDESVPYYPITNDGFISVSDYVYTATVPEGCVFIMGDNRNNSYDSRDKRIGFIDENEILGKVVFRILPLQKIGSVK